MFLTNIGADQIFLNSAIHSDYYTEYNKFRIEYEQDHRKLYKMYCRNFLKDVPMEMGPDIKEYVNNFINEVGMGEPEKFEMPRTHRKYFYMF